MVKKKKKILLRQPDIYLSVPHHLSLPFFSTAFHFPHLEVGLNAGAADPPPPPPSAPLIQCQPSDIIPHRHRLVSGAPSADWQALEVVNCRSSVFSQPARSLTHPDRYISEVQWQLVIAGDDRSSPQGFVSKRECLWAHVCVCWASQKPQMRKGDAG